MALLTREIAFAADNFRKVKVDVSEWTPGEETFVYVRELSAREKDKFENSLVQGVGRKAKLTNENVRTRLAVLACCDENGERIFRDEDVDELAKRPASALSKIFEVAQRLNGVSDEDVEELVKNSPAIAGLGSGSSSPS